MKSTTTDEEIIKCIHELNINKASAGKLFAEHFKYGLNIILPNIRVIFNRLFDRGNSPPIGLNLSLYLYNEKGDGIALLDIFSKIYIFSTNQKINILCK